MMSCALILHLEFEMWNQFIVQICCQENCTDAYYMYIVYYQRYCDTLSNIIMSVAAKL